MHDTKSNKPIGMARVHLCRLLREKTMQIEEPFQLLGAGPNSKILMTLQLRVRYIKFHFCLVIDSACYSFIFIMLHKKGCN